MNELRAAVKAINAHSQALLLYGSFVLVASLMGVAAGYAFEPFTVGKTTSFGVELAGMVVDILRMAVLAAGQAVVFSRIGKALDRPLWRVESDGAGLRQFFGTWFVINLTYIALWTFSGGLLNDDSEPSVAMTLLLGIVAYGAVMVPIGACVMFARRLSWKTLGQDLLPLMNRAPSALAIVLFSFFAGLFLQFLAMDMSKTRWALPVVDLAGAYVDCVVFAAIWAVCKEDRDHGNSGDFEF